MQSKIHHIILSGGVGSRLWPLSRKAQPKQYLKLFEGQSLLQKTIERNNFLGENCTIVCNQEHKSHCKNQEPDENINYLIESTPRNTAAAIAFAALSVEQDDILVITPADHYIKGEKKYKNTINKAINLANQDYLVTFGIQPTRPETGYGYIHYQGDDVLEFVEKPSLEKAKEYLSSNDYLWNSGMFCFKSRVFLEELKKLSPEIYETSLNAFKNKKEDTLPLDESRLIPSESVDIAVMEKSDKIKVIPCDFEWTDLGSFESLYDYLKESGYPVDSNGNMAINTDIFTTFVGVANCIFVSTDNAFLILQKEKSQDIKSIYNDMEIKYPNLL